MSTMHAIRLHRFGGPEELVMEALPAPQPAEDEILIRVHAASVNPVDYKTREGKFPPVGQDKLPIVLGRDVSGVVTSAGPSSGGFRPGDAVYAMLDIDHGGYAEYTVTKGSNAAAKPLSVDHIAAAAVPLAGLTAWQGLFDHGQLESGQRVLIHGGAGGVGHFAVQFARDRGATVYATVSGSDEAIVRQLGAHEVIDSTKQRFEDVAQEMDLVLDLIGGEVQARSFAVLKRGGALISTLTEPPREEAESHGIRGARYMTHPSGEQLRVIAALIDQNKVWPIVAQTFPLARAGEAQQAQEHGSIRGKIVLTTGG